ncbi:type II secretion system minor pseudopilin GspI [Lysobacter sp. A3-1-A15]|uniref:type II secretion system minor pseudopilin GspI n=1 Tax=Novilysobacter viscosus TaxID=3098602 RepID=UPI002EDB1103
MATRVDGPRGVQGFSLVEMLVALAVFSLVVLGLLNLSGQNTRTAAVIEERALAAVVADNRAVEALLAAPGELPAEEAGVETSGGRTWHWARRVLATDDPGIVRVQVQVVADGATGVAGEASLFRGSP